jgi:hypothetical protein
MTARTTPMTSSISSLLAPASRALPTWSSSQRWQLSATPTATKTSSKVFSSRTCAKSQPSLSQL